MIQNANNPQALVMQMAQRDPLMNKFVQVTNQYGGDYNKAYQELSKQSGINVGDIMRMI